MAGEFHFGWLTPRGGWIMLLGAIVHFGPWVGRYGVGVDVKPPADLRAGGKPTRLAQS
jgi:hypothetical protein